MNTLSLEQKEKELNGKRYKVITSSIQKRRESGDKISYEMEIYLHHAFMKTMEQLKSSLK